MAPSNVEIAGPNGEKFWVRDTAFERLYQAKGFELTGETKKISEKHERVSRGSTGLRRVERFAVRGPNGEELQVTEGAFERLYAAKGFTRVEDGDSASAATATETSTTGADTSNEPEAASAADGSADGADTSNDGNSTDASNGEAATTEGVTTLMGTGKGAEDVAKSEKAKAAAKATTPAGTTRRTPSRRRNK